MTNHQLANIACGAAIEFDNQRLERPHTWEETNTLVAMLRQMFPDGGTVQDCTVGIRDILIMKDVLKECDEQMPVQYVNEVVAGARAWALRVEMAAASGTHHPEIAAFCLALSKYAAARSRIGSGHTLHL